MICSMTGFASLSEEQSLGTITVELRSVNHRYLDLQFRLPEELRGIEPALREIANARLSRGKAECRVSFARKAQSELPDKLSGEMLARLLRLETQARAAFPQAQGLSVADVLRWPGMTDSDSLPMDQLREQCEALLVKVLGEFSASRAREGEKLKQILLDRVNKMEAIVAQVKPRIPQLVTQYQERLSSKLREAVASLDEDRIRQELVLFASKVDVDEELARLCAHLGETRRILEEGGAAGKRLDFLMQELNRETNTLGSKSVDVEVSRASMDLKVLIEQMREQVQNIE
ncbi:MAG: YicC family protein [Betaproteobacteria bacterium]|nr:YicC family protein [Betaproteobacteria bacterium]